MKEPKIIDIEQRKLIGIRVKTSFAADKTSELWRRFRPRIKEIANKTQAGMYSVQVYDKDFELSELTPTTEFEKWAAVEVYSFDELPDGMNPYTLSGGKYAVFIYRGMPSNFAPMFHHIFNEWLPNSKYDLDKREHFEILGNDYNPFDPNSQEEVWIPIKHKQFLENIKRK